MFLIVLFNLLSNHLDLLEPATSLGCLLFENMLGFFFRLFGFQMGKLSASSNVCNYWSILVVTRVYSPFQINRPMTNYFALNQILTLAYFYKDPNFYFFPYLIWCIIRVFAGIHSLKYIKPMVSATQFMFFYWPLFWSFSDLILLLIRNSKAS